MRNAITATRECRTTAVIHAEQGGFLAALVHPADEIKKVRFSAAKRIVVLVAIQNAHGLPLVEKCGPGVAPQTCGDFAGDCRKGRCWPRPRAGFRPGKLGGSESK